MSTATRVTGFLLGLAALFALSLGLGRAFGPAEPVQASAHDPAGHGATPTGGAHRTTAAEPHVPGGLMIAQGGYALELAEAEVEAGDDVRVEFTVSGPDGRPLRSYHVQHEKRLHLIAVRRDLTGFQHVHPVLSRDGAWSATLDVTAGDWRLFADFRPGGADPLTLGADLAVAGDYRPETPVVPSRTAQVGDYSVTLEGDLAAGEDARLTLSVERNGEPVTDLEPYLGAYGHLVALRAGDLAYLHVHPEGEPGDGSTEPGPDVEFTASVPSSGTYHLFLDFKHRGVVRTAAFTLPTEGHVARGSDHADDAHTDH